MVLYAILMFSAAALVGGISIAIYRGKTNLIHDYHQSKVTDRAAYGKAFGKALSVISVTLALSGIAGLFGVSEAIAVLLIGLLVGIACIIAVQKKYNQGIF